MTNLILTIHISTAILSISGFIIRGLLHFMDSDLINRKWFKITPHIIDTLLIVSAIILLVLSGLEILNTPWLQAKIIALFFYIGLGLIAFRFAKSLAFRLLAWCGAILLFAYIFAVAVSKNPAIWA